jgi:hypothetical protein
MYQFTAAACEQRAEECVRLANLAADEIVRAEILTLRQTHLAKARRLMELEQGTAGSASTGNQR